MCIFFSTFNFWCLTLQKTLFWMKILALKSSSSRRTNQFPLLSAPKGNEPAAITELPSTSIIIAVLSICQGFLNEWNKTFFTNHLTKEWKPHKLDKVSAQYKCLNLNLGEKFTLGKLWCKIFDRNILVGNFQWTIFGGKFLVGNAAYVGSLKHIAVAFACAIVIVIAIADVFLCLNIYDNQRQPTITGWI